MSYKIIFWLSLNFLLISMHFCQVLKLRVEMENLQPQIHVSEEFKNIFFKLFKPILTMVNNAYHNIYI